MAKINIKNYTSQINAETSISRIEKNLVKAGCNNILKSYEDEILTGLSFTKIVSDNTMAFKVEAKTKTIYKLLMAEYTRPTEKSKEIALQQSERTAWKIISDWIEIQLTLIHLEQADFLQVFLPYIFDHTTGKTFYNKIQDGGFKLLN
jgi:hypothetical protein